MPLLKPNRSGIESMKAGFFVIMLSSNCSKRNDGWEMRTTFFPVIHSTKASPIYSVMHEFNLVWLNREKRERNNLCRGCSADSGVEKCWKSSEQCRVKISTVIRITPSNLTRWSELLHPIWLGDPNYPKFTEREFSTAEVGVNLMNILASWMFLVTEIYPGSVADMSRCRMAYSKSRIVSSQKWMRDGGNCYRHFCWSDPNYHIYLDSVIRITPYWVIMIKLTVLSPFHRLLC